MDGSVETEGDIRVDSAMVSQMSDIEKERTMRWDSQNLRGTRSSGGRDGSDEIMWPDFRFPPVNLWNAPPSPQMLNIYHSMWYYTKSNKKYCY